jgi:hypothetical protein
MPDETFAIDCAERFDFNEPGGDDTIAASQRERWPGLREHDAQYGTRSPSE